MADGEKEKVKFIMSNLSHLFQQCTRKFTSPFNMVSLDKFFFLFFFFRKQLHFDIIINDFINGGRRASTKHYLFGKQLEYIAFLFLESFKLFSIFNSREELQRNLHLILINSVLLFQRIISTEAVFSFYLIPLSF